MVTSLHKQSSMCIETRVWAKTSAERKCAVQFSEQVECAMPAGRFGKLAHTQLARPAGLLFLFLSPILLQFFSSLRAWMCLSITLNLWGGPQKQDKASALQLFLYKFCSLILVCVAQQQMQGCCHSSADFIFLPSPMFSVCLLCSFDLVMFGWSCYFIIFFPNTGDGVFDVCKGLVRTELGKGRRQPLGPYYFFFICVWQKQEAFWQMALKATCNFVLTGLHWSLDGRMATDERDVQIVCK